MSDQLPGVDRIDLHEGRLTGPFDLLRADMAQVSFGGRVMVVVIADVLSPLTVVETKDGDIKAKWTLKAVDVALVRDAEMQGRLSDSLHMIGMELADREEEEDVAPPGMMGVYDEEGAFLGFQRTEAIMPPIITGDARAAVKILLEEEEDSIEEEEDSVEEVESESEPKERLFRAPGTPPRPSTNDTMPPVEERETFGRPIRHDDHLASFLDERVPA